MTPRDEAAGDGPPEPGGRGDPPRPWELPSDDHSTVRADDSADDDLLPDLRAGDEPVPGYRLVARLGAGATGVVWEAVGPGGFPSALKFTRLGAKRAHELGSLELVRGLRHAHLLPVFGAWERDGYLVVGMELADETLADRLARATASGLPGIPFPELVEYMGQAARGIDYLNGPGRPGGGPGVRHCDIKPQNLLLVGDTVKVGDFGLARTDSEPGSDSARESLTPAFAAPELARNRPTDRSDQYSLAVTYVLLRGGRLPFAGTAWSMLMDHAATPPDLSMLPVSERPVVARALAKRPEDRWADCRQFVRELARVAGSETPPPRKPRRRLVPVAAAGLLAAGLV
ncbi:MAG: serine/threonine protein kinase, partial [Gemmataceae bacterium]|nr:serine/threonine protein kinase [Gemmataceae bacterium]